MGHGLFIAGFPPGFSVALAVPQAAEISSPVTASFLGLQADPSGAIVSGPLSPSFGNWLMGPVSWFAGITEPYETRTEGSWRSTKQSVVAVVQEILMRYLDNDPDRISTNKVFRTQAFPLTSGGTATGNQIFFAVARLERPLSRTVDDAVKELGGYAAVVGILKRKYLGLPAKAAVPLDLPSRDAVARVVDLSTSEAVTNVVQEILVKHLNNDPDLISSGPIFFGRSFPLESGGEVSGRRILSAVVRLEKPEVVQIGRAIRDLGGYSAVVALLKRKYLNLKSWSESAEGIREVVREILRADLGNDPDRITTSHFSNRTFSLASGIDVTGFQILSAVARMEKPAAKSLEVAVKELGGHAAVVEILKKKYLQLDHWWESLEGIRDVALGYLDNDPDRISASKSFFRRSLPLASGGKVSGQQILYAVARLERPEAKTVNDAIEELGGQAAVIRILKEKYLGLTVKAVVPVDLSSAEAIKEVTQEILERYLDNDPDRISTHSFLKRTFPLVSEGKVSGQQILYAVARLERPEAKAANDAIEELGGQAAVVRTLKEKYLGSAVASVDLSSVEAIKKMTQEILTRHLDNDPAQVSTAYFLNRSFLLASGRRVSGYQILYAVARFERPGMKRVEDAVKALGGRAAVIDILKKNYLGLEAWSDSVEGVTKVVQGILKEYLNDDPDRISTSPLFLLRSFSMSSGGEVSGNQILFAVARLERPEVKRVEDACIELGGHAAVLEILKGKYLGLTRFSQATPSALETFIQEKGLADLVRLFDDDPSKLFEALAFLKADVFRHQDLSEFVRTLVGMKVGPRAPGQDYGRNRDQGIRTRYLDAILKSMEAGASVELSDRHLIRQSDLLIRLCRRSFEAEPANLLQELQGRLFHIPNRFSQKAQDFLRALYERVIDHFERTRSFQIQGLKISPYGYQREGAHFLTTHDSAILADEAGMGKSLQAIAAIETLGLQRVLWVTTASNKGALRGEILEHTERKPSEIVDIISGDPQARAGQIRGLGGERYLLINYESLREIHTKDPEGYARLTEGLEAVIVDEAQLTDNPEALRTKAIHDIQVKRRWLLTATPYQSKLGQMWSLLHWIDPEKYPNERAFRELYTESTQGLLMLRSELTGVMLRRTKRDTLGLFQSSEEIPFEQQLEDGLPRLPRLARIPPEDRGGYELSLEQSELIARMTADFSGWAAAFNESLPKGAKPVDLSKLNPLQKLEIIHKAIYDPGYFGIKTPNPLWEALDRSVAHRMERREKVILWAWNTSLLDEMEKRYESHGVRRIDGMVRGQSRETARGSFQQNADVMILAANYLSGGVGLTLTAAHADIFVQLPMAFPLLYQASGRKQRLIGLNNLRHAKDRVEEEWMVPRFPEGFVDGLEDEGLAEILSHGTLVEQVRRRLEGGEYLYNMVMDGYGNPEDLEKYFRVGLLEGMGL